MTLQSQTLLDGNRFAKVTPDDHSAWIWIPTVLSLIYSLCFLAFRAFIKRRNYGADDVALILAYVFAVAHWITAFFSLNDGLGRSSHLLDAGKEHQASLLASAGRIPYILSLALAKCSVVLLVRHVFTRDLVTAWRACNIATGVFVVWGILSVLTTSVNCPGDSTADSINASLCAHEKGRVIAIASLDALGEVGILGMLYYLILPLQMDVHSKFLVILAFSFRLINVVFIGFAATTFVRHLGNPDPSLSIAMPGAWAEALLGYSLMSTTIPCIRSFMKQFHTNGLVFDFSASSTGGVYGSNNTRTTETNTRNEGPVESHQLQEIAHSVHSRTPLKSDGGDVESRLSGSYGDPHDAIHPIEE